MLWLGMEWNGSIPQQHGLRRRATAHKLKTSLRSARRSGRTRAGQDQSLSGRDGLDVNMEGKGVRKADCVAFNSKRYYCTSDLKRFFTTRPSESEHHGSDLHLHVSIQSIDVTRVELVKVGPHQRKKARENGRHKTKRRVFATDRLPGRLDFTRVLQYSQHHSNHGVHSPVAAAQAEGVQVLWYVDTATTRDILTCNNTIMY
jgi:hypothetical protein